MQITNNHPGVLGLPGGTELVPGIPTTVEGWAEIKKNEVVKAWIEGKVLIETKDEREPVLLSTDNLPETVQLTEKATATRDEIVQRAFTASGLSIEDWNKLAGTEREQRIAETFAARKAEAEHQETDAAKSEGDKDALLARAKELGIDAKGTWGEAKLKDAIAKAEAAKTEG